MTERLISFRKIEFIGSSTVRDEEHYHVAKILITRTKVKKLDLSKFEIDVENDFKDMWEYKCTCKSCSVKSIPNGKECGCVFVKSLKAYLKLKKHRGEDEKEIMC